MARSWTLRSARLTAAVLGSMVVGACSSGADPSAAGRASEGKPTGEGRVAESKSAAAQSLARLPLSFEPNQGQANPAVKLLTRGRGYGVFLTSSEAVLRLTRPESASTGKAAAWELRMALEGAVTNAGPVAEDGLGATVNYVMGGEESGWHTNLPTFAKARYRGVYPGTDLVFYGNQSKLEYDFVLQPGADPSAIGWTITGAQSTRIDDRGDLVLTGPGGEIRQDAPRLYQPVGTTRVPVDGGYLLRSPGRIGFSVGAYDHSLPLVIDPVLNYSTYLGGSGDDDARDIVVSGGGAYVTGSTTSVEFPLDDRFQPNGVGTDAFVTKLSADGSRVVYSTYLGGAGNDEGHGIDVADGNAYVTGLTDSIDFPLKGAFQPDRPGPDAFVTKLSPDGSKLEFSTYLGGGAYDQALAVAVADGNAYVTGYTDSVDFPVRGAFQTDQPGRDAFVTKLRGDGAELVYSTYLGGAATDESHDIAVSDGEAFVTGFTDSLNFPIKTQFRADTGGLDAFVTKLRGDGSQLVYSTYLGGAGLDRGTGISVADGNAYVTGFTDSIDFPIKNRYQPNQPGTDAFVTKLRADGSQLLYSTYLGGGANDQAMAIAVADGNAYVTGFTESIDFPLSRSRLATDQPAFDAFVTKLRPDGIQVVYSTYVGGSGNDGGFGISVDGNRAYVAGSTDSIDFPIEDRFQPDQPGRDAFVTRVGP